MAAGPSVSDERARLYMRLGRRNAIVGILRYAVPGAGIALAGFLIFQIALSNLAESFGVGGVRLEQDQLVLDTPSYSGVMSDGTRYEIVAGSARADLANSDIIELKGATITTLQPDGYTMTASADMAVLNLGGQRVAIDGVLVTRDSKGVNGRLNNSTIDWPAQLLTAQGDVRFDFEDGAAIEAQSLVYDAGEQVWDFRGVRYTLPGDGGLGDEGLGDEGL